MPNVTFSRACLTRTLAGLLLGLLLCTPALAFTEGTVRTLADGRKLYEAGFIRIIYATEGPAAAKPADADSNGIPDQVEDIAKQFWAARHVLCDIYGFPDPIGSKRYPKVRYVEATIRSNADMLDKQSGKPYNGIAYSRPEKALGNEKGAQSLRIALNQTLNPARNTTVAHEYFHLIQNAATEISTRWYYEGLARWAEDCLAQRRSMLKQSIPDIWQQLDNAEFVAALNAASYDGSTKIWYPTILTLNTQARIPLPGNDPLQTLTYSDKSPVLKDGIFPGATFVRQFLSILNAQQNSIKDAENYPSWDDVQYRRNPRNTPHLLKAMKQAQPKQAQKE